MIEWFVRNPVAANLLMFAIIIAGLMSAVTNIPVEGFPDFESDAVRITTSFRGATPDTAEKGVTLRIEEAIADIEGIEEITSRSSEGRSLVIAEVSSSYNKRDVLDDVKVRVDALNTLPQEAEKPIVSLSTFSRPVITVAVQGDVGMKTLRETAVRFREGLLAKDQISNVELQGVANYEMSIEVSPQTLDDYNLTLDQIGLAIRNGASDISAGNVQTRDGDILIRSDGQAYSAAEFASVPIIANAEGKPITLGEIANINDGFEETPLLTTFNGDPAVMLEVSRVGKQSAIQVAAQTKNHIKEFSSNLPSGVSITYWRDSAAYLKTRIGAVLDSAMFGGILVMLLLSLFLRPGVAFWVFLGIPVSFMGAFIFMPFVDGSFNVLSLFAFIMVLGIVVDDAIVTGESIYQKIRDGMDPVEASIKGTREITVPVTFGILTTVAAFAALGSVKGTNFSFYTGQTPMVVIPIMLMSLVESKLILPSHMTHIKRRGDSSQLSRLARAQQKISHGLERFVEKHYRPALKSCLRNKAITLSILFAITSIIVASAYLGHLRFSPFPRIPSGVVSIFLTMPESTGFETTDRHIQKIVGDFKTLQKKYSDSTTGVSVIENIYASSGSSGFNKKSNIGTVQAALQLSENRIIDVSSTQIGREVRELIGDIPGAQSLNVRATVGNSGAPINIELSGADTKRMSPLLALLKEKLASYPGIFDIQDNYSGGKEEFNLTLKPRAYSLGLRLSDVALQVRNSIFGYEAQRIQRGRDELRVMVRYPAEHRSSINDLKRLPIRVPNSNEEVLLSEIAEATPTESPTTLYRLNRTSIINVTAEIDKDVANGPLILGELTEYLNTIKLDYPDVNYRFDGEAQDVKETNQKLMIGVIMVLIAIYALLAIPFKSYGQPLIVMSIIPFSLLGAVIGHVITFQPLSVISIFGMLAMIGVVVNDSLVLVDNINKRRLQGMELYDSVVKAACTRFRPVLLTSITTFAGLAPILMDNSQQANWLKPMATSLAFGILFSTIITLLIVPVNYILARRFKYASIGFFKNIWGYWLVFWNAEDSKQGRA